MLFKFFFNMNFKFTLKMKFISKSRKIHDNKYNYSLVEYNGYMVKVKIICPIHGIFEQRPTNHISGRGCPKCGNRQQTTELFILKARKIHGDKYDYSLVDYKNAITKVKIICPIHGEFKQKPTIHLSGRICPTCNTISKQPTEKFILKSKNIHGDKYDYSLVDYKNAITKVKIICPIHGEFKQLPSNHLAYIGCPKCGIIHRTNELRMVINEFIQKVEKLHKHIYDYSLVNYVNSYTKVKKICHIHGIFEQLPTSHINGNGCPKCGKISTINKQSLSTEQFIVKARKIYGDRYDYTKVEYKNAKTKVIIICPIHGEFEQTPVGHMVSNGCKKCYKRPKRYGEEN